MPNPEFVYLMTGVKITYTQISNVSKTKKKEKNQLDDGDDQSSETCPLDRIKKCNYPCCRRNAKKKKPEPTEHICPRKTNKPIKTTCQKPCNVNTSNADPTTPKEINRCRAGNNNAFDGLNKTYPAPERKKRCCKSKNRSLGNISRNRNNCSKRSKPCNQSLDDSSFYDWTSSDENQKPSRNTSNSSCRSHKKQNNGECPSGNGQCSSQSCTTPTQNLRNNQSYPNNISRRSQQENPRSRRSSYRDTNSSHLAQVDRSLRSNTACRRKTRSSSFPRDSRKTNQRSRNNNEGQCCGRQNSSCRENSERRRNKTPNRTINESPLPMATNNFPDRAENSIIYGPRYDENWNSSINSYEDFQNGMNEAGSNFLTSEALPRNRNIMPLYDNPNLIEFSADANDSQDLIEFSADTNNFPRNLLDNSIPRIRNNRSDWDDSIGFDDLNDTSRVYVINDQYPVTSTRRNSRDQSNANRTARSLASRRNSNANTSESQLSTRSRRSANNSCNCRQNRSNSRNHRSQRGLNQTRNISRDNGIINNNWENEQNPYNHPSMAHIEDVNMSSHTSFEDSNLNINRSEYDLRNERNTSMPDLREPIPNSDAVIVLEENIPDIRNTPMPHDFYDDIHNLLSDNESTEYPNCSIHPHIDETPMPEEMLSSCSINSEKEY